MKRWIFLLLALLLAWPLIARSQRTVCGTVILRPERQLVRQMVLEHHSLSGVVQISGDASATLINDLWQSMDRTICIEIIPMSKDHE